ncbi:MAG: hypothetical protein IJV40_16310 [Oscillospiraceae bacterium]|nr:hypothetical protein [Oscillospiraceae bacterium]
MKRIISIIICIFCLSAFASSVCADNSDQTNNAKSQMDKNREKVSDELLDELDNHDLISTTSISDLEDIIKRFLKKSVSFEKITLENGIVFSKKVSNGPNTYDISGTADSEGMIKTLHFVFKVPETAPTIFGVKYYELMKDLATDFDGRAASVIALEKGYLDYMGIMAGLSGHSYIDDEIKIVLDLQSSGQRENGWMYSRINVKENDDKTKTVTIKTKYTVAPVSENNTEETDTIVDNTENTVVETDTQDNLSEFNLEKIRNTLYAFDPPVSGIEQYGYYPQLEVFAIVITNKPNQLMVYNDFPEDFYKEFLDSTNPYVFYWNKISGVYKGTEYSLLETNEDMSSSTTKNQSSESKKESSDGWIAAEWNS